MIILSANGIGKTYGTDVILDGISFRLKRGDRVGVIGANGAGKSTMMDVLAGRIRQDEGDIWIRPDTKIGYLRQSDNFTSDKTVYEEMLEIFSHLTDMEKELEALSQTIAQRTAQQAEESEVSRLLHQYDDLSETFQRQGGFEYRSEINGILNSMAFPERSCDRKISMLSGGERTRLALAGLLLRKPDLLLLDEPTNHLDIGTLRWLEQYLKSYTGAMMIISHDRYFLDQTVTRVFEVEHHRLTALDGNYSTFAEKKRQLREAELSRYETQQRELRRQEEIIRRFKQHGTEKLAKRAQSREKRLAHLERAEKPEAGPGAMKIQFHQKFKSGDDVLYLEDLGKGFGYGEGRRELFTHVNLDVKKGERICMVGANGIGKTTLLRIIQGEIPPDTGYVKPGHNVRMGYYDQEQSRLNEENTILGEMKSEYRLYTDTEMRSILGRFLFRGDAVFQKISTLSGGEKARLSLLKMMLSGANTLLLDEPTNHLDITSREIFEEALLEFPGTVLAISHDRYFLNRVATGIAELTAGGLVRYPGGYDYYVEKKSSTESAKQYLESLNQTIAPVKNRESITGDKGKGEPLLANAAEARRRQKAARTEARRIRRELENLEAEIAALEEEQTTLEAAMCDESIFSDHLRMQEYHDKLKTVKENLAGGYDRWMELNEKEKTEDS